MSALIVGALLCYGSAMAQVSQRKLSSPNPSKEAAALYRYLLDMEGKVILSGQQVATWGVDEMAYIQTHTGKQPAIRGMDYLRTSEIASETQEAINYWRRGGIPTIMWHFGAPGRGDGYDQSKMTVDFNRLWTPGTTENTAYWDELKKKADALQKLRDANVPVLWRPYHECSGNWFWWGKGTPAQFKRLWTEMHDYFVKTRGLNNLIWVLCYSGEPNAQLFPGNQYVDIAGPDTYTTSTGPQLAMYNRSKASIGGNVMPIAFHECGIPPDPDQCFAQGANWSWWMEWHTGHLEAVDRAYLKRVYNHSRIITLDEVPNIMAVYGGTITGMEDENVSLGVNSMSCSPNPFTNELKVQAEGSFTYTIYDMEGNEVENGSGENAKSVGAVLVPGMYLVKLRNAISSKVLKVVKQ